ncbi:MAG: hypothetical protein ACRD23_08935 [Terriglobales bacterium]
MATAKISPLSSHTQFPIANNLDTREIAQESFAMARGCSLHLAIIQQPVRRWEKPWRHQRAIVLFARSSEETKLRIHLEGRIKAGELVLQIIPVGE